jgi:hypothetical protein
VCTHHHMPYHLPNPLHILIAYLLTFKIYTSSSAPSLFFNFFIMYNFYKKFTQITIKYAGCTHYHLPPSPSSIVSLFINYMKNCIKIIILQEICLWDTPHSWFGLENMVCHVFVCETSNFMFLVYGTCAVSTEQMFSSFFIY